MADIRGKWPLQDKETEDYGYSDGRKQHDYEGSEDYGILCCRKQELWVDVIPPETTDGVRIEQLIDTKYLALPKV